MDSHNERQLITKTDLRARGWTDSTMKRFLPDPVETKRNPKYKKAAPMKLFDMVTITVIENSPEFKEWQLRSAKRRQSTTTAAETKRQRITDENEGVQFKVPKLSRETLIKRACAHFNQFHVANGNWDADPATPASDPNFLARICVNYLRHQTTTYDAKLATIKGRVGVNDAYRVIRMRVLDAIAGAYPFLAAECRRQGEEI